MPYRDAAGGSRDVKRAILDAAETVFAGSGFEGATTRAIAEEAGVNLALLHYHFGSKEHLFEYVVSQRASEINATRRKLLAEVMARTGTPRIEDVLEALFRPAVEYSVAAGKHGRNHARIVMQLTSATDERSVKLVAEIFDAIALEFVAAIEKCFPTLSRSTAVWVFLNAAMVNRSLLVETASAHRLANGHLASAGAEETISCAVKFVSAGIRALVPEQAA